MKIYFCRIRVFLVAIYISMMVSGCVSILDATSKGPIQTDPGKRSFGDMLDDKRLNTIIAVNIKKADSKLNKSNIQVTSYNSVVLITGQVLNKELRELAAETARDVHKVRQVYNELEIMPNISLAQRASDRWLDTKIGTKLFASKQAESHKVKIVVENSVVYLMGMLNKEQTKLITDIVRNTKGVTKVVRAIEYVEDNNKINDTNAIKSAVEAFDDAAPKNAENNDGSSGSYQSPVKSESYYDQIIEEPNSFEESEQSIQDQSTDTRNDAEVLDSTPLKSL